MKHSTQSHYSGHLKVPSWAQEEISSAIQSANVIVKRGTSTRIRDAVLERLTIMGWPSKVTISQHSKISVTSIKKHVGLCVQTGNTARMYADLMKLQTLYLEGSIKTAAIIVPSQQISSVLGWNIAHATRLERELKIFSRVYTVPTLIFALE